MAKLEIDLRAAAALDARAEELLKGVTAKPNDRRKPGWEPDIAVKAHLTDADIIGEIDMGGQTPDGRTVALDFLHDKQLYTLAGEHYATLLSLIPIALKTRSIRDRIAEKTIEQELRRWVRARFRKQTSDTFTTRLLAACDPQIADYRVWTLIERLHVETRVDLGPAQISEVSRDIIDAIANRPISDDERRDLEQHYSRYRGHAAVVITIQAEPQKAVEHGRRVAERALAALSLCFPAAFRCNIVSAASLWGTRHARQSSAFLFDDREFKLATEGIVGAPPQTEHLSAQRLEDLRPIIRALSILIDLADANPLPGRIMDALLVYQRSIVTSDPAEKLIYIFVALEMILLRDANEPVQDNIATRIAFLIGRSVSERRDIIATVKSGYALRSAFIHHGVRVSDTESADELLAVAWRTLVELVQSAPRYRDPNELIRVLEDRKLQ